MFQVLYKINENVATSVAQRFIATLFLRINYVGTMPKEVC